jgi:hypothetical protein
MNVFRRCNACLREQGIYTISITFCKELIQFVMLEPKSVDLESRQNRTAESIAMLTVTAKSLSDKWSVYVR